MAKIIPEYTAESVREISSDDLMYRKSAFMKNGDTEMIKLVDTEIERRINDSEVNERDKKIARYAQQLKDMDIDQLLAALGRMVRQESAEPSYTAEAHDARVQVTMIQDQIRSLVR